MYNQQDHHLFIATEWDNIVGFGHMAKENSDWEVAVSVDREYQGRGIGDSLMGYMIPWAKIHGVHNVFMHCITQNQKIWMIHKVLCTTVKRRNDMEVYCRSP